MKKKIVNRFDFLYMEYKKKNFCCAGQWRCLGIEDGTCNCSCRHYKSDQVLTTMSSSDSDKYQHHHHHSKHNMEEGLRQGATKSE